MESENDQFMRHAVQPRLVLVAAALGALRHLRTGHQAFGTNVGAIEAAVKLLADRTAAIVIALKGHPDQVRRQKTIGAWKDIVHARELQRTEPLAEASAPSIYRLPLSVSPLRHSCWTRPQRYCVHLRRSQGVRQGSCGKSTSTISEVH